MVPPPSRFFTQAYRKDTFLAALVSKGETPEEVTAAWEAIDELDTVHVASALPHPLMENSGTGMDRLKTFNASSAAAIVAAAAGVPMARHGARALTSRFGTVDIMEALGVCVECGVETVAESIRRTGIGLFNGMSAHIHPSALGRILAQIRFGSTLNIAASLANPARPTLAVRGVYSPALLTFLPRVMKEIGYRRTMLVHGLDGTGEQGTDELSTLGETRISELSEDGCLREYRIAPEDVGLPRAAYTDIAPTSDLQTEAIRFVKVLAGKGHSRCVEFVCLNAAAILQVAGKANDLKAGVEIVIDTTHSGNALAKLGEWVQFQQTPAGDGIQRFEKVLRLAGIKLAP